MYLQAAEADEQLVPLERRLTVDEVLTCRHVAQRVLDASLAAASGMGEALLVGGCWRLGLSGGLAFTSWRAWRLAAAQDWDNVLGASFAGSGVCLPQRSPPLAWFALFCAGWGCIQRAGAAPRTGAASQRHWRVRRWRPAAHPGALCFSRAYPLSPPHAAIVSWGLFLWPQLWASPGSDSGGRGPPVGLPGLGRLQSCRPAAVSALLWV